MALEMGAEGPSAMKTPKRKAVKAPARGSMAARKRGRKRISESRATEIRARLAEWKQIPEPIRISLRALAAEMGTSHQLLAFYLRRWDMWQAKEYQRSANDICTRAEAEKRTLTASEQAQVVAYTRASLQSMINSVVPDMLTMLRREARRGKLSRQHLRLAKILARKGYGREVERIFSSKRLRRPHVQEPIKSKRICHTAASDSLSPLDLIKEGWQLR
jgi:hypothetical protein